MVAMLKQTINEDDAKVSQDDILDSVKAEIKESIEGIDVKDIDPNSNEPLPELNEAEEEVLKEAVKNLKGGIVKQAVEEHLYKNVNDKPKIEKELMIPILSKSTRFQINGDDYSVFTINEGQRRFTCKPVGHDTIPAIDEKFMYAGNEYRVNYINTKTNNRFSCVPYIKG